MDDLAIRKPRIIDLDVTRAVALIGVTVMNYYGYMLIQNYQVSDPKTLAQRIFDPWEGPLSTRFAATFCLVAGAAVTLFTQRSRLGGNPQLISADRWRLVRRGFLLYAGGVVFNWIWPGTILFFYGAMFMVAAVLFTLRTRWLALVAIGSAAIGAALQWWALTRDDDGAWLFYPGPQSPRGLLLNTFVNGTHPLFPWLAFFCAGMILGRHLAIGRTQRLVIGLGGCLTVAATYVGSGLWADHSLFTERILSTHPDSRSLVYTANALGSALAAFCVIGGLAEVTRHRLPTRVLAAAGRTSLTLYVGHALVFNLLVNVLGWVRPTGLDTALVFALGYWIAAIVAAALWQRRYRIGPLEVVYRKFGG